MSKKLYSKANFELHFEVELYFKIENMDIPEFFKFDELYNCEGVLVPAMRALKNKKLVGFLFSASWSSDCEEFLSSLKQIYQVSCLFNVEVMHANQIYFEITGES